MKLTSQDFRDGGMMDLKFTCDGEEGAPQLEWNEGPAGSQSFALRCFDPDAPGKGWLHWLVVNIPADYHEIPRGGMLPPTALPLENDFGKTDYGGPCPPSGVHRYEFILYALNTVELEDITPKNFITKVKPHTLATATLTGRYQRRR